MRKPSMQTAEFPSKRRAAFGASIITGAIACAAAALLVPGPSPGAIAAEPASSPAQTAQPKPPVGATALAKAKGPPAAKRKPARAETTAYPSMIGEITRYEARHEDTLVDLARRFNVGYTELRAANPLVDPWLPGQGAEILIPTAHLVPNGVGEGVVLNLADQRLYYFKPDRKTIVSVPVGIGSDGWSTPTGKTWVVRKRAKPTWYVPKSIRAAEPELPAMVPPGPENPLGEFAIYLGWRSYLIHGTNKPYGVGRRVSHGCVRLYPEDIAWLFKEIGVGTQVTVLDQPVKIAWVGDELMLEVHPSQTQADQLEAGDDVTEESPPEFGFMITQTAGTEAARLDWEKVRRAVLERSGLPVSILKRKDAAG